MGVAVTWIVVDAAYVRGTMTIAFRNTYDLWAVGTKQFRLRDIAVTVVDGIREGLARNPWYVMNATTTTLPSGCVPYALTIILYRLTVEMDLAATIDANVQATYLAAEAYVLWLSSPAHPKDPATYTAPAPVVEGRPSYTPGEREVEEIE
jgi:hypothetical protein